MSNLIKKLLPYLTAGVIALGISGCKKDQNIIKTTSQREEISNLEGIIKSGKSDQKGKITFIDQQTKEKVVVNTKYIQDDPISGAEVDFWDGDGWELFWASYFICVPYLHIFEHNSEHDLKLMNLVSGRMQFHNYTGSDNNNSLAAAKKFVDYTKTIDRHYIGCLTAEEAKFQAEQENNILDLMKKEKGTGSIVTLTLKNVGKYYKVMDKLIEWGILEGGDCAAFQKWYIVPPAQGSKDNKRVALWYWECLSSIPNEICDDRIDNDCDHKIDYEDSDCQGGSRVSKKIISSPAKPQPVKKPQSVKKHQLVKKQSGCNFPEFMSKSAHSISNYLGVPASDIEFESGKGVSITIASPNGHALYSKLASKLESDFGRSNGTNIKMWGSRGQPLSNGCYINIQRYSSLVRIQVFSD